MNRNTLRVAALSACGLAGALWLWSAAPGTPDASPVSPTASDAQTASHGAEGTSQPEAAAAERGVAAFEADLAAWRGLHAPVGYLSQEETEALIAEREAAAASLAADIAGMDGAELESVFGAFQEAHRSRDKLVMIAGLGDNPNTEALSILEEIYTTEGSYTLRSTVLQSLGDSPAEGHHELLVEQMWSATDERLQQLSVQSLYGEGVASEAMIDAVHSTLPVKVRLEAIHSLGATGSDVARQALRDMSQDTALEARVRLYAEKELARTAG